MIPDFNEHGYLPPGIHRATLEEVIDRFGHGSEPREAMGQSLRWLLPMCKSAGGLRLLVNGSFITDRPEPNDVDCVMLVDDAYNESTEAADRLLRGVPFIELKVARDADYTFFATVLFGSDRKLIPKGVVEVLL